MDKVHNEIEMTLIETSTVFENCVGTDAPNSHFSFGGQ